MAPRLRRAAREIQQIHASGPKPATEPVPTGRRHRRRGHGSDGEREGGEDEPCRDERRQHIAFGQDGAEDPVSAQESGACS
jgi:hypothetical protein